MIASRIFRAAVFAGTVGSIAATSHTLINLRRLRTPTADPKPVDCRVSVLVPARDEAANVGHCLASVRGQVQVQDLEVLVLDDRSSDGTAQVVEHHTADQRVRLIKGEGEPPQGWLGKTWACQRLADNATGDVLVFVDADVVLTPDAVAACVQLLQQQDAVDAVCPYPRQICDSIAERLVQPLLQWSWLTFLPLKPAESSSRPSLTAANGQLLAITRASYDRVGGHAAVRSAVMEDVGLFRALKRVHGRGVIADGSALATCRMYDGWRTLRVGYSKSLWAAFGSNKAAFLAAAGLTLLYVLPPLAMLKGSRVGAVGYASAVVGRVVVARRTGGRAWPDAAAHPISITVFAYLTSHSVHKRAQGTLQWKGRPLTTVSGFGDNLERA